MLDTPLIVFAITHHGLGHLTRSLLIVQHFHRMFPNIKLCISTGIDRKTISRFLSIPFSYRKQSYEPGTYQKNCFEIDLDSTRLQYRNYFSNYDDLLADEIEFLRTADCIGLISDIPALPIRAAAALKIPAIGISNFTWDWILEPIFKEDENLYPVLEQIRSDYASGSLHLRLPFGPSTSPFPNSETAPLVARKAANNRSTVKRKIGVPENSGPKIVVVCPGGWDPEEWPAITIQGCSEYQFVLVGDLPISGRPPHIHLPHSLIPGITFPDLVNAADAVIAKPGYGIAAECVLHRTPMVAIERPRFRETPILMGQLGAFGPCTQISLVDFFQGKWQPSIEQAIYSRTSWQKVPENGAETIAQRLGNLFSIAIG